MEVNRGLDDPPEPSFVRRGFGYRASGEEGFVFVALGRTPAAFEDALRVMLAPAGRHDALLDFATARAGAMYVVPPSAAWLVPDLPSLSGDLRSASAQAVWSDLAYQLYEITPATKAYMDQVQELGGFETDDPEVDAVLQAAHHKLAGGALEIRREGAASRVLLERLARLRAESEAASGALNDREGRYVSVRV